MKFEGIISRLARDTLFYLVIEGIIMAYNFLHCKASNVVRFIISDDIEFVRTLPFSEQKEKESPYTFTFPTIYLAGISYTLL
jgi:hypothetical protein